jgi:hypothetical protein
MKLNGRRIHFVGSAKSEADPARLEYTHALITALTKKLAREGATFVLPFGKEPLWKNQAGGAPTIFDWTVAVAIQDQLTAGTARAHGPNGHLIETYATTKTDGHIPTNRRATYDALRKANAIDLSVLPPGWSAGALRRERLAQLGDIFIGVSGGQGLEQLALEYSSKGKPIIPLDIDLGSSLGDGAGGAARLFERALSSPDEFFKVLPGHSAASLLDQTRTGGGAIDVEAVVTALLNLLRALVPPRVFYVRLLNDKLPEYPSVERFFRTTVDTLVTELGYEPLQMGIGENEFAWMNQAIFDSLHHSSVVLVDLTGLRTNCFMELGYALGNKQRVIITARDDTKFPFDAFALEAFQWKEGEDLTAQLNRMRTHWERNINMPTLVRPKEAR